MKSESPCENAGEPKGESITVNTIIQGRVWKFGDDIDTDAIIPARYLNTSDPAEMAKHCMEDADPEFPGKVRQGYIVVAGRNFGCGSSREHAPLALKTAGVTAVVAESFARIFYRNAIGIGLPIFEAPEAAKALATGDEARIDPVAGEVTLVETGQTFKSAPFPEFMQSIIELGGIIPYVRQRLAENGAPDAKGEK
jgi:3-isopropylmalate dehydratase small subunit